MKYISTNPSTGKVLKEYKVLSTKQLNKKLNNSTKAFEANKKLSIEDRCNRIKRLSDVLDRQKEELATSISVEMGKPIKEAISEVEKCKSICQYYAENAKIYLANKSIDASFSESTISFEPIGTVLGIMPWNFPFWQVFRFAVPAMVSGNSVLLKHAPNVPHCAEELEQVFNSIDLPENIFQNLYVTNDQVEQIIKNDAVQGVSFTGSLETGSIIGKIAGKNIKKSVLELGGNDAFIILADANLKRAAAKAVQSKMLNCGQSCIGAKRWIVEESIAPLFIELVTELMNDLVIDDPRKKKTDIGPMARPDLLEKLLQQMKKAESEGAKFIFGGKKMARQGNYIRPGILTNISKENTAFREELFGPIACLITVKDAEEAIEVANDSKFGLGASVWSTNIQQAQKIAKKLNVGSVFINEMVMSDVHLPFGGTLKSGNGRELGEFGILEFVNIKTTVIN